MSKIDLTGCCCLATKDNLDRLISDGNSTGYGDIGPYKYIHIHEMGSCSYGTNMTFSSDTQNKTEVRIIDDEWEFITNVFITPQNIVQSRIEELEYKRIGEVNKNTRASLNGKLRELRYILKKIEDTVVGKGLVDE